MVPFKRTAGDKSGIPVYQPGATTYQQLMQLQQPFVPVSCEYPISSSSSYSSTSSSTHTATTLIPHTSTATLNANNSNNNNNHILVNQNSVNNNHLNSTTAAIVNSNGILSPTSATKNNNNNNNFTTVNKEQSTSASMQISLPNSTTTVTSNHVPVSATGTAILNSNHLNNNNINNVENENDQSIKKSVQECITNSTSINNNVTNHSNYSSVSSMAGTYTTPNAYHTVTSNASMQPHAYSVAYTVPQNTYNPYFTMAQNNHIYHNPAAIAKEVAQKNYANALKLAAASNALTGKPLSALTYSSVPFNKPALLPQPYPATPQLTSPRQALAAPVTSNRIPTPATMNQAQTAIRSNANHLLSGLSRPQTQMMPQNPYAQFFRPQLQAATNALGQNPFAAQAAMAANQQFMMYQNLAHGYSSGATQMTYPGTVPTSMQSAMAHSGITQNALSGLTSLQGVIPQPGTPGSAVVLNPYKKMKTS